MGERLGAYLLLLAVSVPCLTVNLVHHPALWFDEGYKINAAWTFAEHGVYGTETVSGPLPFDPGISAGPMVILPLALVFETAGVGIAQARLVIVGFTLVAILAFYELCRRLYGPRVALAAALAAIAIGAQPQAGLIQLGRQVMSEAPALAYALVGWLLWFASWRGDRRGLAVAAGVACGCAILAKLQISFGLVPALALVGWAQSRRRDPIVSLAPLAVALALLAAWTGLEWALSPEAVRAENRVMFLEVAATQILAPHWGARLGRAGALIAAFQLLAALAAGLRLLRRGPALDDRDWAELTVIAFVGTYGCWYAFVSIGWTRYGFAGLALATALWAGVARDVCGWALRRAPGVRARLYGPLIAALALLALCLNLVKPLRAETQGAPEMAAYIRANVAPDAVIESWDLELDALSGRWTYHHPHQRFLFLAERRYFVERANDAPEPRDPFALEYDPLQADPQYIVSGPLSEFTRIYDRVLWSDFRLVATFGRYRLFERVR